MIENMPCYRRRTSSERKINAVIDTILRKDSCRDRDLKKQRRDQKYLKQSGYSKCQAEGNEGVNNGIESSARFSLRVMEAMRSLQRSNENQSLTSSNMEEIVNYIEANYQFDGDLDAQVRTVLSRISRQGFIMSVGKENYHLLGPFATYMNENGSDQILVRPAARRIRARSRRSPRHGRHPCHRKDGPGRPKKCKKGVQPSPKVIKDPELKTRIKNSAKNQDIRSRNNKNESPSTSVTSPSYRMTRHSRNKNGGSFRKSKSAKRRKCSLDREDVEGFSGQNIEFNEDYQSGNSSSSYVTCCDDLNANNAKNGKQVYKNGVHFCGISGPSRMMIKNISSSSEEESSQDSLFQELKAHNSKTVASNSKDLKKWIKNCRRGCRK
ncbi:uncharacterized protein LOC117167697 [Belonocnema kinseyi]|uniref:uncharacterized protein LOC117167697 n=1 Tax=Belonocnema kinseyi TaxID=2817044 RepID=UPI00143D9E67|nr:uncharacterized protein LOC117167697 [Belonocnema kinseyi]